MAETQPIVSPPTSSSSPLNTPKMSSTDQIITLFESLSFAEKLSLNERLATSMRKEGGGAAGKKRGPKAKADGEPKTKRKAALGTLAWMAYVKHIKTTQPELLEGHTKESEKLAIIKMVRGEDPQGYEAFVAAWKEEHKDDGAASTTEEGDDAASVAVSEVSEAKPKVLTAAEKIAAMQAAKAAASEAKAAEAKASEAKAAEAKASKAKTPTKAVAAAAAAPKKPVKAAAAKKEEPKMPVVTIDGTDYWHDPSSNGLWEKTSDVENGNSSWIGYYQPEDEENPIRFTEAFGTE